MDLLLLVHNLPTAIRCSRWTPSSALWLTSPSTVIACLTSIAISSSLICCFVVSYDLLFNAFGHLSKLPFPRCVESQTHIFAPSIPTVVLGQNDWRVIGDERLPDGAVKRCGWISKPLASKISGLLLLKRIPR